MFPTDIIRALLLNFLLNFLLVTGDSNCNRRELVFVSFCAVACALGFDESTLAFKAKVDHLLVCLIAFEK